MAVQPSPVRGMCHWGHVTDANGMRGVDGAGQAFQPGGRCGGVAGGGLGVPGGGAGGEALGMGGRGGRGGGRGGNFCFSGLRPGTGRLNVTRKSSRRQSGPV